MSRIPHPVGPTAASAADISGQGEASTLTSLSDLLLQSARNVRVNTSTALRLSQHIADMVDVVKSELELHPNAPWAHSEPLKKVEQVLREICAALEAQGKKSYLAQLVRSERDRAALVELSARVRDAFNFLMIHMRMEANSLATALSVKIETLAEKHTAEMDAIQGVAEGTVARCPPARTHYFGRTSETEAVTDAVIGDAPGRVAILGGPGMGKSTLSVAVLHDRRVMKKFGLRRYFVSCDSAECSASAAVAMAFGIPASDLKDARMRLQRLLSGEPSLLVLDNFEAVWEASDQRPDAEDLLRFLDSLTNLSLIVTLRGSERPNGVRWSRPFAAPLAALSDAAVRQTFLSISDAPDDDSCLGKLLSSLDGIPLAIVLMACLAQYESTSTLLSRWNELHTAMIIRGQGQSRQTSLDVSIRLSVLSPRMTALPAAQALLSVLALLPYGVVDTDLPLWNMEKSAQALSVLSQNSLVVLGADRRVRVLAPIRSFVASYYPPPETAMHPVLDHYFGLAGLPHSSVGSAQSISCVAPEVGNITSLALYALGLGHASRHLALSAVKDLCALYADYGIGSAPDLVATAVSLAREAGLDDVRAGLLVQWGRMSYNATAPGDTQELFREALSLYEALGDEDRALDCAELLSVQSEGGAEELSRLYEVAKQRRDLHRMARCSFHHARLILNAGNLIEARTQYDLAISLERQVPNPNLVLIGHSQHGLAQTYLQLGDDRMGMLVFSEALESLEAAEDARGVTMICGYFAGHLLATGRPREAITYAECALDLKLHGVTGFRHSVGLASTLASAYAYAGNPDAARRVLERAQDAMQPENPPVCQCELLIARSHIALACGNTMEARAMLLYARSVARDGDRKVTKDTMEALETSCMEGLVELEPCPDTAVALAVTAAIMRRQNDGPGAAASSLLLLVEVVDDTSAEKLIEAVLLTIQSRRQYHLLAIAHLRRAHTAQRRRQLNVAYQRAQNALRYFGDFVDVARIRQAKEVIEACSSHPPPE